ncbi:MAG: MFS transporter [Patescibacteria group bacterium]
MPFLPKTYLALFKNRDFFILSAIIFFGQAASAFLVLTLIISVFLKTGSNIGVSGVVLSFTIPSFFLMAFSGLLADIFDRRKTIIFANVFITLVVLMIIYTQKAVYASIPLSFLYFAGNSFFIPASSAATAQLVKKNELLVANSIFIFNLAGGVLLGLFAAAVVYFFFGAYVTLVICEVFLLVAAVLSFFLPKLVPLEKSEDSFRKRVSNIWDGFVYMFKSRTVWFFFVAFAAIQGVIVFGITLAPGFFTEIVGISIEKALVFVFPLITVGVLFGIGVINKPKINELSLLSLGNLVMGASLFFYGISLKIQLFSRLALAFLAVPFLIGLGFGTILIMIASRTVLQKKIPHTHQGTVFGANIILASLFAAFASPLAVMFEVIFGYLGTLVLGGTALGFSGALFIYLGKKWKY